MKGPGIEERRRLILESPRIARLILELSIPLFISGSLQSLYGIIDTFWLSRLGSAALGTPTVSWPYRGVLMSIGFGLASSLSALAGQYIGAGEYRRASESVARVLGLLLLIGVPGSIAFYLARDYYMSLARIPPDVARLASGYIAVTLAGVPFMYTFLVFNFALGAAGDTRTPMKVSVATTLLNFILDPLMIFTLGWGGCRGRRRYADSKYHSRLLRSLQLRNGPARVQAGIGRSGAERGYCTLGSQGWGTRNSPEASHNPRVPRHDGHRRRAWDPCCSRL